MADSIAALLQQARAAHAAYRRAVTTGDRASRDRQLQIEADLRRSAHLLDPQRVDPAWSEDAAANKGQSSEALLAFCEQALPASIASIHGD